MKGQRILQAIGFIVLAAAFAALDTVTQFVSSAVPFAVAMWFRFGFQVLTTGLWQASQKRSLLVVSSVLAFFSLQFLPVADFTSIAMLTPYVYTHIPFAMLGGWLVFGHRLDSWSLLGFGIIALSGVLGAWITAKERLTSVRL